MGSYRKLFSEEVHGDLMLIQLLLGVQQKLNTDVAVEYSTARWHLICFYLVICPGWDVALSWCGEWFFGILTLRINLTIAVICSAAWAAAHDR
jgi:hypothetical protein